VSENGKISVLENQISTGDDKVTKVTAYTWVEGQEAAAMTRSREMNANLIVKFKNTNFDGTG